ncbi:MAG: amidohydrolase family protein [Planctomycetaceae bacterium]|nr:amidohydrolase family protein [Planctomycetaceae bacterium]MCB9949983.1 amidohydrolase family protein [Planctomycetaceae bacterium]
MTRMFVNVAWTFRLVLGMVATVVSNANPAFAAEPADVVLKNGRIVTVDSEFHVAQSMAIREGRVVAVGSNADVAQLTGSATKVVDLEGRMVLPGLIDSHVHPTGASMFEADHEIPSFESIGDVLAYVRERTKVVPKGEWITLSQVFITRLREQRYPSRAELDEAAPEHPVLFRTGPDGSANSLALKENGIDRAFAAAHPENVMVDPATGEPNGILRKAGSILKSKPNSNAKSLSEAERDDRLVALFDDYNQTGITGIIDRNCSDSGQGQYERLLAAGRLNIRIRVSRGLSPGDDPGVIEKRLDAFAADPLFQQPHPRLGIIGVKCFEDGGMLTGSAYFRQPWGISSIYGIDDPAYRGMSYIDSTRLELLVRECAKRNLAFTAHCQGDAAVESLVDVYAKVNADIPIEPTRSSVTHSSFMSAHAIETAAKIGVGVDLQPAWLYLDGWTLNRHFGEERLKYFIPLKTLLDSGVRAGGGSDHMQKIGSLRSVNPYNPFLGMRVAATRTARWHDDPIHSEQALSREEMIRFYTINNAWLMRMEQEIGSLEVGKRADFIVIDRDLLTCPVDEIQSTKVLSTWLDGVQL